MVFRFPLNAIDIKTRQDSPSSGLCNVVFLLCRQHHRLSCLCVLHGRHRKVLQWQIQGAEEQRVRVDACSRRAGSEAEVRGAPGEKPTVTFPACFFCLPTTEISQLRMLLWCTDISVQQPKKKGRGKTKRKKTGSDTRQLFLPPVFYQTTNS